MNGNINLAVRTSNTVGYTADHFSKTASTKRITVTGIAHQVVRFLMWLTILITAIKKYNNLRLAFKKIKQLKALRNNYRNGYTLQKFVRNGFRFYAGYNIPAWPSATFNKYIERQLTRMDDPMSPTLHTIILGITKKCGFKCEHCYEWEHLNKPEVLSKDDLITIVKRFYELGVSQVQITGGEPLNRFADLLFMLQQSPKGINYWIYTTGYSLTYEKAKQLYAAGLTGITISLDHHIPEHHDRFRGVNNAFAKAISAASYAKQAGLTVCFSLCATKDFISRDNLYAYAKLAKESGASFIQILEPRAVGHYSGKEVELSNEHFSVLNEFFERINFNNEYNSYPIIAYPGYYGRKIGCSGGGADYLYVDMDGDAHNCPFCQRKLFSALHSDLKYELQQLKLTGCKTFPQLTFQLN